jgi:hypothetical protein
MSLLEIVGEAFVGLLDFFSFRSADNVRDKQSEEEPTDVAT